MIYNRQAPASRGSSRDPGFRKERREQMGTGSLPSPKFATGSGGGEDTRPDWTHLEDERCELNVPVCRSTGTLKLAPILSYDSTDIFLTRHQRHHAARKHFIMSR